MDFESGIEQWLIRRYITIHSFSGIAVHETWHGTSVGGGSQPSARGKTNSIHPGPIRTDLVEWIDPLLYALLVNFFLLWPFLWLLLRYSGNILLWWRVGSENTNAAENDRINRNPQLLRQTTEKERLHVLQVVDLSVLVAASFRIVRTLSLS